MFSSLFISCNNDDVNSNDAISSNNSSVANFSRPSTNNVSTLESVNNIGRQDYFDGSFTPVSTAQLNFTHQGDKALVNGGLEGNGNYIFDVER